MSKSFRSVLRKSDGLPETEEIERFGADGEEAIYRLLADKFDCVIRNVILPHKELYLEKDFMVIHRNVPFILEIKNWKGEIGCEGDNFFQNKENGVHKALKSPVGTTNQFIAEMKKFYGSERQIFGMVVFAEPNCTLNLPKETEGIALLPVREMIPYIQSVSKANGKGATPIDDRKILRCTRFYGEDKEFCKGLLAESYFDCTDRNGKRVTLDLTSLRYLSCEHRPLLLREKLYATDWDGGSRVYFCRNRKLTVGCLDGSFRKLDLRRIRHIVF